MKPSVTIYPLTETKAIGIRIKQPKVVSVDQESATIDFRHEVQLYERNGNGNWHPVGGLLPENSHE